MGCDIHGVIECFKYGSYFTFAEVEIARGLKLADQSPEFSAVLSSMRVLANAYEDENVRLVFWFDG